MWCCRNKLCSARTKAPAHLHNARRTCLSESQMTARKVRLWVGGRLSNPEPHPVNITCRSSVKTAQQRKAFSTLFFSSNIHSFVTMLVAEGSYSMYIFLRNTYKLSLILCTFLVNASGVHAILPDDL